MKRQLVATAYLCVEGLGTGLYGDEGQRLMELLRNALRACMNDPKKWTPKAAKIRVWIEPNHPLAHGPAMVCLDNGRGLTDPDCERYFNWLGTPMAKLLSDGEGSIGDSQKGIGRLAALAQNQKCLDENLMVRIQHGYYLLSRTSADGPVRFVSFIPRMLEEGGVDIDRFIDPNSTEMGPLRGIKGSFTAIVIPNPIWKSHDHIYEAIKWLLPREQDKMFDLVVGAKAVLPPPLESTVNISSKDGHFRARIGLGGKEKGGVWLCDDETGFRVASCQSMSRSIPEPLWFPELAGDIFAPGLLRHQNTARSTLHPSYTRSKEWERLKMFLMSQVAPAANELLKRDAIKGDALKILDEVAEMFNDRFGLPPERKSTAGTRPTPGPPRPGDPPQPKPRPGVPGGAPAPTPAERRYRTINVQGEAYKLYYGQSLPPFVFAQVSSADPFMVLMNIRGDYQAFPELRPARVEHCLMQILFAIGMAKFPQNPHRAASFANEVRAEFKRTSR